MLLKATLVPSGDHTGATSTPFVLVNRDLVSHFDIGECLCFPVAIDPYESIGSDMGASGGSIDQVSVTGNVELARSIAEHRCGKEVVQNWDRRARRSQLLEVEGHRPEAVILRIKQMAGGNV